MGLMHDSAGDDEIAALVREETDSGLLKLMARRDQDSQWADAAWCEVYKRHAGYMWTVCSNVAEGLRGEAWIEDVLVETFERAYEKAATFKLAPGASPGSDTRLVRGWLGAIAANIFRTLLRNHHAEETKDEDEWRRLLESTADNQCEEEHESSGIALKKKLISDALESLSEREQLVIRTTFQYYRIGSTFQRLPNSVSQQLAQQLATTPENLRKIRERALEKVATYLKEHPSPAIYESPYENEQQ